MKMSFDDPIKAHVFFMECNQSQNYENVAIVEADDRKSYVLDAQGLIKFDQSISYLKIGAKSDLRVVLGFTGHEPRN
jgi:hypothetical protein